MPGRKIATWWLTYSQVSEQRSKEDLLAHLRTLDEVREYVIALERHKDGNPHYHAYVKYKSGVFPKNVLTFKWHGITANARGVRGPRKVIGYCIKEGDYLTNIANIESYQQQHGKKLHKDILRKGAKQAMEDGDVHPMNYKRLAQSIELYELHCKKSEATDECKGRWIYGSSGSGKTTSALERWPEAYRKPPTKWWDGYNGQEVVLLDDLRPLHAKFIVYYLTQWMDRHAPPPGETKGGTVPLLFKHFVVTSQWSIEELFDEARDAEAIRRRCRTRIEHMGVALCVEAAQRMEDSDIDDYGCYNPGWQARRDADTALQDLENHDPFLDGTDREGGADSASAARV